MYLLVHKWVEQAASKQVHRQTVLIWKEFKSIKHPSLMLLVDRRLFPRKARFMMQRFPLPQAKWKGLRLFLSLLMQAPIELRQASILGLCWGHPCRDSGESSTDGISTACWHQQTMLGTAAHSATVCVALGWLACPCLHCHVIPSGKGCWVLSLPQAV